MILGKVIGTVVSTQKDPKLTGGKLLIVQQYDVEMKPMNSFQVALDSVGAGDNEIVLIATGSSARLTAVSKDKPIDAVIMGIVDTVELNGKVVYKKFEK
ncbi:MAG: EutN/CcmL family microcompartment protein [bacterium]|nr:EutN/CcmL family microcompartment protein [bacterium]